MIREFKYNPQQIIGSPEHVQQQLAGETNNSKCGCKQLNFTYHHRNYKRITVGWIRKSSTVSTTTLFFAIKIMIFAPQSQRHVYQSFGSCPKRPPVLLHVLLVAAGELFTYQILVLKDTTQKKQKNNVIITILVGFYFKNCLLTKVHFQVSLVHFFATVMGEHLGDFHRETKWGSRTKTRHQFSR